MRKTILMVGVAICIICAAFIFGVFFAQRDAIPSQDLTLSDYPKVFAKDAVIVIGENASLIEIESAEAIVANLENMTDNKPEIISSEKFDSFKYTHNLIILGTPNSKEVLKEVYNRVDVTRVTEEYPGENKGILEIFGNPWNKDVIFSGYASAVGFLPHRVVNHTKGEDGADFRVDMHDWNSLEWNASMNNTGNVTLTNIKVIIGGKVIQLIPELKVNEKKDLLILQPYEFPSDYMLNIVCDQEVKEEIKLSHTVGGSHCFFEFNWYSLPGLTLCILGFLGGILTRKRKKLLIPFTIIFFIGILLIVTSSYVCLPA